MLDTMTKVGKGAAVALQENASTMTGTELNEEAGYLPAFSSAVAHANMLTRERGYMCVSSAGRVVRLLQPYDSAIYTQEPEELPAQWGFVWSDNPAHALPYVAISTSPYMKGNCCTEGGKVYRSLIDNNVWAPSAYPQGWEVI